MSGERRVAVSATARARVPPGDAAPPGAPPAGGGAGPESPDTDPPDPDPLHTGPFHGDPPGPSCPDEASALIRAQLRIALGTLAIVTAVVAGLPALLAFVPAMARARVQGVPLSWIVLVLGVQPLWVVASLWQLRRAEQAERDLAGPVDGP